jgi:rod shape-determining protein MreD
MKDIYTYIWVAPLFILLQVLFLNNIYFLSYINPLVYVILIITLPQNTEKWFLLIYAFILGFSLDILEGNLGLNSSALVFLSFIKPYINKVLIPKNLIDEKEKLNLKILGIKTFSVYALSLIFIHNSFIFLLEHFSTINLFYLILKIILSSVVTYIIILIFQLFTFKTKE